MIGTDCFGQSLQSHIGPKRQSRGGRLPIKRITESLPRLNLVVRAS